MKQLHWRHADTWMLGLAVAWLFWTGAVWQHATWLSTFDTTVANFWHHSPAWFQQAMVFYTQFGNPTMVTIITLIIAGLLWIKHQPRAAIFVAFNTWILAGYGNYLIKQLIARPRPTAWRLVQIGGYSYPSGHSTTTTILIGSLLVIAFDHWRNRTALNWVTGFGCLLVLLMMISRVVVGVHYPSDTIGGLLLGCLLLYISTRLSTPYRFGPLKQKI
ncbi:phosphatase PAP2 family protein [Lactiplantibacillus herbarum]|uniref:phosphatase PAP2 family protein n=1 Tax=Lactiplantibacillus herbarum TaxID=1670446 RepID=UPI00064EBB7B|nr:phosphatase PAP2 family protein [Lactiplantibacillus herbarum]